MSLFKLIPVLLALGFTWNPIMGRELTAQRMKRSLTTICVEIKPSGPQEEPYYMCKGTDLPPLVRKDSGASYQSNNPEQTYGAGSNFQIPSPTYNAQYQGSKSDQSANNNQNNDPGYGGFRRPAPAASYQPPTSNPAIQQSDVSKQQFFPKPSEYQSQQNYEPQQQQQQQHLKSSPAAKPFTGYGLSTGNQQTASYTPSNSPYVSEGGATQAQSTYSESGGNPSRGGGGGAFIRPQSSATAYGSGTKQHGTNGASGSFTKSSLSPSLPAAGAAKASFGQTLPYANAAVASADVEEHGYVKETASGAYMVPTAQKSLPANIKLKNLAASTYGAGEQTKSDATSYAVTSGGENSKAAALYQPSNPKTDTPNLDDYRALLSEDILQSPVWGFSPDEFSSLRSISDEVEQPINAARSQHADSFLRHMPPEYRDDPVMRQFYSSMHEPIFSSNPLLTTSMAARPAYNSKVSKVSTPGRSQVPAPLPQKASPQVKQPAVINTAALCETKSTSPPPPPPQKQPQQCYPDSITGSPYAPPARLTPPPNCEPCNRRDYNFQPVFIALPCYGQQSGFGNLNAAAAPYLNLGIPATQSSYPSPMNQYAPNLSGDAALFGNQGGNAFSGFGPYVMPYTASNVGPFGFYNNPQYSAANRASTVEENLGRQTTNKPIPAARKLASSNERSSTSQESAEYPAKNSAKSTQTTNNEFTMNTSMETAETKATQPVEPTTSVTEATLKATETEIEKNPPNYARTSEGSKEQLVSVGTDTKEPTAPTTDAVPMEKETKQTYESIMSLAQKYSKIHQKEFDFDFDDDNTEDTSVIRNGSEEKRKEKRRNARQQGAANRRQNAPAI